MTGARYFRAIDADRLEEIYEELDSLEPIEYEEEAYIPTTLLYHYPLGASIVLALLLSFIFSSISAGKQLINRKRMHD